MTAAPHTLSVVLPAYDEQDNIERAVATVTEVAERLFADHEVIVVDDGSADDTAAIVHSLARSDPRVRLVQHPENRGYGEALRTGFTEARMDLVFMTDADNQFDVWELGRFLPWIERTDVVVGYRVNRQDTAPRRLNAWGWNMMMRGLFHVPVRDIDCAFKLFRREVFDVVDLNAVGAMVSTELMVKLGRAGLGIMEIGVHHYPRTAGVARGAHPRVIATALREVAGMYRDLHRLEALDLPHGIRPARPLQRQADPRLESRADGALAEAAAAVDGAAATEGAQVRDLPSARARRDG